MEVEMADLDRLGPDLLLSVCGDDALGFLPPVSSDRAREFRCAMKENLAAFGFSAKFYVSDRFEDAVYLGHRPLPVNGVWYWSRTLGRCLYKLGYQVGVRGDPRAYFAGICKMHMVCSSHVPVLSDIARIWLSKNRGCKVTEWKPDPHKPWETMGKMGPNGYAEDTLEALARAYTVDARPAREDLEIETTMITPDHFRDLLSYLERAVQAQPCTLDHWLLRWMVLVDEQ